MLKKIFLTIVNPTNTTPTSSVKSTPPRHSVLCTPSLSVNVTLPLSVKSTPALHGVLYTPKLSVLHGTTEAHHIWCAVSTFFLRVRDNMKKIRVTVKR